MGGGCGREWGGRSVCQKRNSRSQEGAKMLKKCYRQEGKLPTGCDYLSETLGN